MAKHYRLGREGEKIATEYLSNKNYTIRHTNWFYRHKELDIVAQENNTLVIAEVKTRKGDPDEIEMAQIAVNRQKQRFIIEATNAYINEFDVDMEVRFDVIAIIFSHNTYYIKHIEDAFYPMVNE